MTGRVIGSEVFFFEGAVDYSVMHKSANAAAKVTAKAISQTLRTTTDRAPVMHA